VVEEHEQTSKRLVVALQVGNSLKSMENSYL